MKHFQSSIGKKIQIAITGLFLAIFLLFHLGNNLVLFFGPNSFNNMVLFLEGIKPVIRIMEFSLLLILVIHVYHSIQLAFQNKKLRKESYEKHDQSNTSTLNSRTMVISGSVVLLFIIIHLVYIWGTYQTHAFKTINETYYDVLLRSEFGYLNNLGTSIFYIMAIFLIGFHLRHGIQSAFQTLGLRNNKHTKLLQGISFLFWGIIPLGFIIIVLSIQAGYIK